MNQNPEHMQNLPFLFFEKFENIFPKLSKIAKFILNTPASSSNVERFFSLTKEWIYNKRNRLSCEKVEKLQQIRTGHKFIGVLIDRNHSSEIKKNLKSKIKDNVDRDIIANETNFELIYISKNVHQRFAIKNFPS